MGAPPPPPPPPLGTAGVPVGASVEAAGGWVTGTAPAAGKYTVNALNQCYTVIQHFSYQGPSVACSGDISRGRPVPAHVAQVP